MIDYKTLKEMSHEDRTAYLEGLDEEQAEELLEAILAELSEDDEVTRNVYETGCVYYIIYDGAICEMTNDASSSPKGGWFPPIVTGLTAEEKSTIKEITESLGKYGDLDDLFSTIVENIYDEFDDDEVIEYFQDDEDEDYLKLYKRLMKAVQKTDGMFSSVCDFYSKMLRIDLEEGTLYYIWEGDFIDLYENIADCGEARGEIDEMDTLEWIEELCDLGPSTVWAD